MTLQTKTPDNGFYRAMAAGHLSRKGHRLECVLISSDGETWSTLKTCCGETVPAAS